jgi:hypothetical protein
MGKVWFLLQNTWKNKYFRVVSAEYMASCKATISFVHKGVSVALVEKLHVVDSWYAETNCEMEECAESNEDLEY